MGLEQRGRAGQIDQRSTPEGQEPMERQKPEGKSLSVLRTGNGNKSFEIPKRLIYEAWEKVRDNDGAPGIDGVSISYFKEREADYLYKLWNRMSSGSYMPGPVRAVEIPKDHGEGIRTLGVPNVYDRVAQTAVARLLEEKLEPIFHPDSYGYRPGRSPHDALAVTRKRCWRYDWVVEFDIRAFFDSVSHDLLLKAVAHHTDERWVLLCIERWLKAPMQMQDGTLVARESGTPQGSPISPVLANLFLHYAFDKWMDRENPDLPFERYADDGVIHCDTEEQARRVLTALAKRFEAVGLVLHPTKSKVVFCKDANRPGNSEHTNFDFLGFTFRGRLVRGPRGFFVSFSPAMSAKAKKAVGQEIRSWHLKRRSGSDLADIAEDINPGMRSRFNYYGAFTRSAMYSLAKRIDEHLVRWVMHKFKRFRGKPTRAWEWLAAVKRHQSDLFVHWQVVPAAQRRPVGAG
jgi:RNA-directed DNA polymerase